MLKTIGAFARLTRIEHAFLLSLAVVIGEAVAGYNIFNRLEFVILSILPAFYIEIASFAMNDYFDRETDRLNKRFDRPLVSGEIRPLSALFVSILATALGIGAAWMINWNCFVIAFVFAVFAWLYNYKLKDLPLVGNMYIAATMAIPFIFGSFAAKNSVSEAVLFLSLIAFVTGLGREIMITTRDVEGDKKGRGSRTLPMVIGERTALFCSVALFGIAVVLSFAPLSYPGKYFMNIAYLIPVFITDLILVYVCLGLVRMKGLDRKKLQSYRKLTLMALGTGLIGFLAGAVI